MNQLNEDSRFDEWSEWLLRQRFAGPPEYETIVRSAVRRIAHRVLDSAELVPGMTIVDIGTGDGLIAFNAIDRIGPSLRAILTDISVPLLQHAEQLAKQNGVHEQCSFLHCSAEKLDDIPTASVDVVTTRAVLAYVSDKPAALREFCRVLKPGGRISIAEPILRDEALETMALRKVLDAQPPETRDRFLTIAHRWRAAPFPDTEEKMVVSPITNYTERDLVRFAQSSGFSEIHLAFHIDVFPSIINSWDTFLGYTPHPWASSVATILAEQCCAEDRDFFERVMRPMIEHGRFNSVERVAYLTAIKPDSQSPP